MPIAAAARRWARTSSGSTPEREIAGHAVLRLSGLVAETQGHPREAHCPLPIVGLVLQVPQGSVDLAEHLDVVLGLEDGAAPLQQVMAVLVAPQTQQREISR
jgi:hypothetical protein